MTLADMRRHIAAVASIDNTAASEEQVLMDDWINEGIIQFLMDTGFHASTGTIALVNGTSEYTLDGTALLIHNLWIVSNSQIVPLEPITFDEMLMLRRTAGTDPTRFYTLEGDLLSIYPTPTANGTLNIRYTPKPAVMSLGTDDFSAAAKGGITVPYQHVVELWAKAKAAEYTDDAGSHNGLDYFAQYDTEMKKARGRIRRASGGRLAPAKVGPPAWRSANLLRNDQDPTHR